MISLLNQRETRPGGLKGKAVRSTLGWRGLRMLQHPAVSVGSRALWVRDIGRAGLGWGFIWLTV